MPLVGSEPVADRRRRSRRGFVVYLVIVALTVSLASRISHASFYRTPTAHSNSVNAKIQQRDYDASEGVSPAATLSILWIAEPSPITDFSEAVWVRFHCDSLYNRPPPLS